MVKSRSVIKMLDTDVQTRVMFDDTVWYQLSKQNSSKET